MAARGPAIAYGVRKNVKPYVIGPSNQLLLNKIAFNVQPFLQMRQNDVKVPYFGHDDQFLWYKKYDYLFNRYQPSGAVVNLLTACNTSPPALSKLADGVPKLVKP